MGDFDSAHIGKERLRLRDRNCQLSLLIVMEMNLQRIQHVMASDLKKYLLIEMCESVSSVIFFILYKVKILSTTRVSCT